MPQPSTKETAKTVVPPLLFVKILPKKKKNEFLAQREKPLSQSDISAKLSIVFKRLGIRVDDDDVASFSNALYIMQSKGNIKKKLDEVGSAIADLASFYGKSEVENYFAYFNQMHLSCAFAEQPTKFTSALKNMKNPEMRIRFWRLMMNESLSNYFQKSPEKLANSCVQICDYACKKNFYALSYLDYDKISVHFLKNQELFINLAKKFGDDTHDVLSCLTYENLLKEFVSNPDRVMRAISLLIEKMGQDNLYCLRNIFQNEPFSSAVLSNPEKVSADFAKFIRAMGKNAGSAFESLGSSELVHKFLANPNKLIEEFSKLARITLMDRGYSSGFYALTNKAVAKEFASNPNKVMAGFEELKSISTTRCDYISSIAYPEIGEAFVLSQKNTISAMKRLKAEFGSNGRYSFMYVLETTENAPKFKDFCLGKYDFNSLAWKIRMDGNFISELGFPLDEYHSQDAKRKKYLASLKTADVLALLVSNPEWFYTSTNHMLFDRLRDDLKGRPITDLLKYYGLLGTEKHRNLIFRAIMYGRFYGENNSVFTRAEMANCLPALFEPMEKKEFDRNYYYLLANSLEALSADPLVRAYASKRMVKAHVNSILERGVGTEDERANNRLKERALGFLISSIGKKSTGTVFDASEYCGKDGKLEIVQVFDKKDTEKDHWVLSQKWFSKYGPPKTGKTGELIFETKDARIVLFMGNSPDQNQDFIKQMLAEKKNFILSFRGHSFSLDRNIPSDIFGNSECNVLFIPGSCGSAHSVPDYIASNPRSNLAFIGNTSTGRGQVTNTIIDALILEHQKQIQGATRQDYSTILQDSSSTIEKQGGNIGSLKAASLGEHLLAYVYSQR